MLHQSKYPAEYSIKSFTHVCIGDVSRDVNVKTTLVHVHTSSYNVWRFLFVDSVVVNRVATYRELDNDLLSHAQFLSLDNEVDLKLLARNLSAEADVQEVYSGCCCMRPTYIDE